MKDLFREIIGEIGVNRGKKILIPIKPLSIEITKIREDGVVYARLVSGGEIIISASLDTISKKFSELVTTPIPRKPQYKTQK